MQYLEAGVRRYVQRPPEKCRELTLKWLGERVVARLSNGEYYRQRGGPHRGTKHKMRHAESLHKLDAGTRYMEAKLLRSRAQAVGGTLELAQLGLGHGLEQVRCDAHPEP